MAAALSTAWPELLDALEERTRRLAGALDRHEPDPEVVDVELVADGPLPAELAMRVRVLLAETQRLQDVLVRRTGPQARARAAYAGH